MDRWTGRGDLTVSLSWTCGSCGSGHCDRDYLDFFSSDDHYSVGKRAKQRPSSSHLSFWPRSARHRHSDLDVQQDGDHHRRGQRARRPLERQAHCSRIEEGAVERTREARGQHDPMSRRRPVSAGKLLWPSLAGRELTDSSKVDTRGRSWAQRPSASRCGSTTCDTTPPTQTGSIVTVSLCSVACSSYTAHAEHQASCSLLAMRVSSSTYSST